MRILLGERQRVLGPQIQARVRPQLDVEWVKDVPELAEALLRRAYPLFILAFEAPEEERLRIVHQCREVSSGTAIMMVSDTVPVQARINAFEAGVDDFVMRPFHADELAARAKALVRRSCGNHLSKIRVGNVELTDEGELYLNGIRTDFHQAEQKVLSMLVRRSGKIVSKAMIDRAVTGVESDELSANAIEQRMSRLRKMLEHANARVQITTIRGAGYVLEPSQEKRSAQNPVALQSA